MAAIDFPANPLDGDTCVRAGKTWTYSSAKTRWSAEATAASGGTWGSITGTLSSQTDLQTALNAKQATLVSGTNIKTVNGSTLLGSGNLTISSDLSSGPVTSIGGVSSIADAALSIAKTSGLQTALDGKSPLAGSSSITTLGTIATGVWQGTAIGDSYISSAATWNAKQAALVSGTNIKTVGGQSILGSGNLSVATIGAAATSHTHVSADITDATSAATADTVVKRGSSGEASFASNSAPTTALSASNTAGGRGATATSSGSGSGAYGSSATGAGLEGYSSTGVGILATSNSGTNHAEFGGTSDNRSFVQRVSGLFGWWRGAYKQTIGAATTLTADRAVLLPDANGTLLISSLNLSGLASASTARTNLGLGTTDSVTHGSLTANTLDISESLGAEMVVNGGFDADTNWTKGSGWTIAAGVATHGAGTGTLVPAVALVPVVGTTYKIQYTVSNFSVTGLAMSFGGVNFQANTLPTGNGTLTYYVTATAASSLSLAPLTGLRCDIDNISIKPVLSKISSGSTMPLEINKVVFGPTGGIWQPSLTVGVIAGRIDALYLVASQYCISPSLRTNSDTGIIATGVATDCGLSRASAGVWAVGTGAAGSTAGSMTMTNLTTSGALNTTPTAHTASTTAIPVTASAIALTTTGANTNTLAAGTNGQILTICHVADGGSSVLTPASPIGFATITFTNVGDAVTLQYHTGGTAAGWYIVGSRGVTIA